MLARVFPGVVSSNETDMRIALLLEPMDIRVNQFFVPDHLHVEGGGQMLSESAEKGGHDG